MPRPAAALFSSYLIVTSLAAVHVRNQHFSILVQIVVGKNGHVVSAHAISGPPETSKACENAVQKWVFDLISSSISRSR